MADVPEIKNALWRREEQLRRWDLSETNKESSLPRDKSKSKIKFQDGCVFLAACSSGDKDEVEKLLEKSADINTANIDGLTALHQACIDDNLDMVTFLVGHGADIDACDNEGWTALHATASCGFLEIAKYLIEKGANVAAVNNDGELAIDIAEGDDMEDMLFNEMEERGVDADAARNEEEECMLRDANTWLSGTSKEENHAKTGATALHVASAKGYIKVINVLFQIPVDIDAKDLDGWTPLMAAAHWGQEEACKVLVENFANMEEKNNSGQTVFDLCDPDLDDYLDELKEKQATLKKDREADLNIMSRGGPPPLKRRSSVTRMSVDQKQNVMIKNAEEERALLEKTIQESKDEKKTDSSSSEEASSDSETEKQNKINSRQSQALTNKTTKESEAPETDNVVKAPLDMPKIEDNSEIKSPTSRSTPRIHDMAKENHKEADKENERQIDNEAFVEEKEIRKKDDLNQDKKEGKTNDEDSTVPVTRPSSTQPQSGSNRISLPITTAPSSLTPVTTVSSQKPPFCRALSLPTGGRPTSTQVRLQAPSYAPRPLSSRAESITEDPARWRLGLRKTGSSSAVPENTTHNKDKESEKLARSASSPWLASERRDDSTKRRPVSTSGCGDSQESRNRNATATTTSATTSTTTSTSSSSSGSQQSAYIPLSRRRQLEQEENERKEEQGSSQLSTTSGVTPTSPTGSTTTSSLYRRSYEPPKRDEERETERKAKARRARETRRSTQGVTKEDLERAEQTLKQAGDTRLSSTSELSDKENRPEGSSINRRLDEKDDSLSNRESLRRSRDSGIGASMETSCSIRGCTGSTSSTSTTVPSSSSSSYTSTTDSSSYRSPYRSKYLRDDDTADTNSTEKEDPSQKSSAIRTRRKRESRRPTGKIALEDLQDAADEFCKTKVVRRSLRRSISCPGVTNEESSTDKTKDDKTEDKTSSSRYGSSRYSDPTGGGLYDRTSYTSSRSDRPSSTTSSYSRTSYGGSTGSLDKDGAVDYKKLYLEEKQENDKLRKEVKKISQDLTETKLDLEKARLKQDSSRSIDSSADRREKRALERKLSELEEELKAMENLKADNQRLKEENGALIRVISKLSK